MDRPTSRARDAQPVAPPACRQSTQQGTRGSVFFFSSRRRHTRSYGDWSSDVCSSDLAALAGQRDGIDVARVVTLLVDPDEVGFGGGSGALVVILGGNRPGEPLLRLHRMTHAERVDFPFEIGRASCGKECRSGWLLDHR